MIDEDPDGTEGMTAFPDVFDNFKDDSPEEKENTNPSQEPSGRQSHQPDIPGQEGEEGEAEGLRGDFSASKKSEQPSEPKPRVQSTCPKCGTTGDAFYMKIHIANCEGPD